MILLPAPAVAHHHGVSIPASAIRVLALGVWLGTILLAWFRQYSVDYETSLLPWLVSRGWVLYRDIADQHPPLFPLLLAVLGGAGDPGLPLQRVVAGLLGLTLALTYGLAARLAGPLAGLAALSLAALWLLAFDGTHLWYDSALAPVYLGTLLLLARLPEASAEPALARGRWRGGSFWSTVALGGLLGIGILIKQHASLVVPVVAFAVVRAGGAEWRRRLAGFAAGLAAVLLGAAGLLAGQGALAPAWYWVVTYSLSGAYAISAALAPSPGEWPLLYALYAPAAALLLAWLVSFPSRAGRRHVDAAALAVWTGFLLAATLPAWPRYGEAHLYAAIPLLAVAAGVALMRLAQAFPPEAPAPLSHSQGATSPGGRDATRFPNPHGRSGVRIILAFVGLVLLAWSTFTGAGASLAALRLQALVGAPAAPYATTAPALRAWVDAHAPPTAPIVVDGLDSLLYRVLQREPPRPWTPQLPWMLATSDAEARWWIAVAQARVPVALVSASGWDLALRPGLESGAARLRYGYHEAARFPMVVYHLAPPVQVVGLLRNSSAPP